jgi:hypothetical protein
MRLFNSLKSLFVKLVASIMKKSNQPVSGYGVRLEWLEGQFRDFAERAQREDELRSVAGWYLRYGFNLGMKRKDLLSAVNDRPKLVKLLKGITEAEIQAGKPLPVFPVGTEVEVIVNAKNLTYHKGTICEVNWHHKNEVWNYYLKENGKKVKKRYLEQDLRQCRSD